MTDRATGLPSVAVRTRERPAPPRRRVDLRSLTLPWRKAFDLRPSHGSLDGIGRPDAIGGPFSDECHDVDPSHVL